MNKAAELEEIASEVRACKKCRLWKTRRNAVPGEGPATAKVFFVGQAPGREEDRVGRPFIGMAGKFLDNMLSSNGLDRRRLFITSPLKCFPPGNRRPKKDELSACKPFLERQLAVVKPKLIVILGDVALQWFFPKLKLKEVHGKLLEWAGTTCIATFHPAAGMRFPKTRRAMAQDFKKIAAVARRYM